MGTRLHPNCHCSALIWHWLWRAHI